VVCTKRSYQSNVRKIAAITFMKALKNQDTVTVLVRVQNNSKLIIRCNEKQSPGGS
jgi:hypothetical protein